MAKETIFYTADTIMSGFKAKPNISFSVRLGYIPEAGYYVAVRDQDPLFCFTGKTLDESKNKARAALEFYCEHGLQEAKK